MTTKTLKELSKTVQDFCEARDWDQFHDPKELAIGIITESSELLEHFRFKTKEQMKELMSNPEKKKLIEEELADVLYFVIRFAQMNNINLEEAFTKKMELNAKKYPIDKIKGSNKKYTELQ